MSAHPLPIAALLVVAFAVMSGAPAAAQATSHGPLTFEEGGPFHRVSLTPTTDGVDPVATGSWRADLWFGYSNIFEQDSSATYDLFLDMERLVSSATVRYGLAPGLEVGGRLTLETTGGGILDSFIVWWHDKLGLGNANRERYPFDEYRVRLESPRDRVVLDVGQRTLGLEDVRLFAKWRVARSEDGRGALSLRGIARIPTRENAVGEERVDFGLMAIGRVPAGAWFVHGHAGASTVRRSPEVRDVMRGAVGFLMLGVERPLTGSVSVAAQYALTTPVLKGFDDRELDQPAGNLVFGLVGRRGESWRWEASFQEDVPADTPAIDFTLGLKISRVW